MLQRPLGLIAVLVVTVAPLAAQDAHPGVGVRVEAPSFLLGRLEAVYLGHAGDTLLFGNDERGPVAVPSAAITKLEISGGRSRLRGAVRGGLFVGAVATIMGALIATSPDTAIFYPPTDGPRALFVANTAFGGALFGAALGAFIPVQLWKGADRRLLLNAAARPSGAVNLRVSLGR